jgi:hypothetical protein
VGEEKMENIEPLAKIVFARTAKGVDACKASNSELTRQLKSLLLLVDGYSPVSKFIPFLTNLLPLSEKFSVLEQTGYIQQKHISKQNESAEENSILAIVLHEIENFLVKSAGTDAKPVMSIFKNMTTVDQIKEVLPTYFDLISRFTIDAGNHALKLEKLIS